MAKKPAPKRSRPLVAKPPIDLPEGTSSVTPQVPLPTPDTSDITKEVPATMTTVVEPLKSIPLPATTTEQEDLTTHGQRRINLIWEYTQAFIALFVTIVVIGVGSFLAVQGRPTDFPPFIALAYGLIMGFYFQRTNHTMIGGTGPKPATPVYEGR